MFYNLPCLRDAIFFVTDETIASVESFAVLAPFEPSKLLIEGRIGKKSPFLPFVMLFVAVHTFGSDTGITITSTLASCYYVYVNAFCSAFLPSNRIASVRQRYLAFS